MNKNYLLREKGLMKIIPTLAMYLVFAVSGHSAIISNWINWNAPGSYPGVKSGGLSYTYASGTTGTILMPDSSTVNVTLSGEIMNPSNYSSSGFGIPGDAYWSAKNYNNSTYLSANVPTLPSNSDRIAVGGFGISTQTLTFSNPVSNIVMNLWSLGNPNDLGSWQFSQPFVILSQNTGEYPSSPYSFQTASGNTLNGYEGSGTIQFTGTFSSLSWEIIHPEVYAVWNIGVTSAEPPNAVPEPGQVAASLLLLAGIGGYVFLKRRKAAKVATPAHA